MRRESKDPSSSGCGRRFGDCLPGHIAIVGWVARRSFAKDEVAKMLILQARTAEHDLVEETLKTLAVSLPISK